MLFDPHPPLCDDPEIDILGQFSCNANFQSSDRDTLQQLPLPGIVIFVHGVNSDGEWYEQAEQGLCDGLNARLKRRDEDLAIPGPAAGQMQAATYARDHLAGLCRPPDCPFPWRPHETVPRAAHARRCLHVCAIDSLRSKTSV